MRGLADSQAADDDQAGKQARYRDPNATIANSAPADASHRNIVGAFHVSLTF